MDLIHSLTLQASSNLFVLLGVLPRDSITEFLCWNYALDKGQLGLLLRTQTRMETMAVSPSTSMGGIPGANYVRGTISRLQTLEVQVRGSHHQIYANYVSWFAHAPQLHTLIIEGRLRSELNLFEAWTFTEQMPLLRLRLLKLRNLHLSNSANNIVGCLHLPTLKILSVQSCQNIEPTLKSLATSFKETSNTSLQDFHLGCTEDISDALEEFLNTSKGLKKIKLRFLGDGTLPNLQSFQECGKTLQTVAIYHRNQDHHYSAENLEEMVHGCPNITDLAISLRNLESTINGMHAVEPVHLSNSVLLGTVQQEYARSLMVLAKLTKLSHLRFPGRPYLSQSDSAAARRWRYAQIANETMRVLSRGGSSVQVLDFFPGFTYQGEYHDDIANEDGHIWPRYTYERGEVSIFKDGSKEVVDHIAVPCAYPDDDYRQMKREASG
ncbi:hypothetical protein EJ07DRAFT_152095 [Lizonia empirigonia]|nr:hypothetical protein EJ07DRAFT_152095 [Lizonia empirigonia]